MINLCLTSEVTRSGGNLYANDGDLGTAFSWSITENPPPVGTVNYSGTVSFTLANPRFIKRVGYKLYISCWANPGASLNDADFAMQFYVVHGAGTTYLVNTSGHCDGGSRSAAWAGNGTYYTDDTGYSAVTSAAVYQWAQARRGCGGAQGGSEGADGGVYEVELWAPTGNYAIII